MRTEQTYDAAMWAGEVLRRLIRDNYSSQEEFAYDFGADVRTVNRYVNQGINKLSVIQELACFFQVELAAFIIRPE